MKRLTTCSNLLKTGSSCPLRSEMPTLFSHSRPTPSRLARRRITGNSMLDPFMKTDEIWREKNVWPRWWIFIVRAWVFSYQSRKKTNSLHELFQFFYIHLTLFTNIKKEPFFISALFSCEDFIFLSLILLVMALFSIFLLFHRAFSPSSPK